MSYYIFLHPLKHDRQASIILIFHSISLCLLVLRDENVLFLSGFLDYFHL